MIEYTGKNKLNKDHQDNKNNNIVNSIDNIVKYIKNAIKILEEKNFKSILNNDLGNELTSGFLLQAYKDMLKNYEENKK